MDGHTLTVVSQETPDDPDDLANLPVFPAIHVLEGGRFFVENGAISSNSPGTTLLAVEGGSAQIVDMIMTVAANGSNCLSVEKSGDSFGYLYAYSMDRTLELHASGTLSRAAYVSEGGVLNLNGFNEDYGCLVEGGSSPIYAMGDDVNADDAPLVHLYNTSVTGTGTGVYVNGAKLEVLDGSSITANPYPDGLYDPNDLNAPEIKAIHAVNSQVAIKTNSNVTANGGNFKSIAVHMPDLSTNGLFDSRLEVSEGAHLTASGSSAVGIDVGEGSVTLNDGFVFAEGTDSAWGVSCMSNPDETTVLTFAGQTEITAQGQNTAFGVYLFVDGTGGTEDSATIVMEDSATIRAEAPDATGVSVYGGNLIPNGGNVMIQATDTSSDGSGQASAVTVYVKDMADPEEVVLKWRQGFAEAAVENPSSAMDAYAVRVVLPINSSDNGSPHAYILPGAGGFEGTVGVVRWNHESDAYVPVTDTNALEISGGSYTVRPQDAYIAQDYTLKPLATMSGTSYTVIGSYAAQVYTQAGGGVNSVGYETLPEAFNAALDGDVIRLYRDAYLEKADMPLTVPAGKTLTLEMNSYGIYGYDLSGDDENPEAGKSVFLTQGTLIIDAWSGASEANGDSLNLGGSISYGNSADTAGGVVVRGTPEQPATFVMYGGEIAQNQGRVGGVEANFADVYLFGTNVYNNSGKDVGGIEGVAARINLNNEASEYYNPLTLSTHITGNGASDPYGTGGIVVSSDPEHLDFGGSLISMDSVIERNMGWAVGGIEANDVGVSISGGRIEDNWGGRTGGMTLTGTVAQIGAAGVVTSIQNNEGGFVGGVQVNWGFNADGDGEADNALNLIGSVRIQDNNGNIPLVPVSGEERESVPMNLALYSYEGNFVPLTIFPDAAQENEDGFTPRTLYAPLGIYTIVRNGETAPDGGMMVFQLADNAAGGGDVYALTGTFTTPFDKDIEYSDYLELETCYYHNGEYSVEWQLDGSYAITRETDSTNAADEMALRSAFDNAEAGTPVTVTLTDDVTITLTLEVKDGQDVTLDLNGHTLTVVSQESEADVDGIRVLKGGNFKLQGPGRVESASDAVTLLNVISGTAEVVDVVMSVSGTGSACLSVEGVRDSAGNLFVHSLEQTTELHASGTASAAASAFSDGNLYVNVFGGHSGDEDENDFLIDGMILALGNDDADEFVHKDHAPNVVLHHAHVTAAETAVNAVSAWLNIEGASIIEANPGSDPEAEVRAVLAPDSVVRIEELSTIIANGGEGTAVALDLPAVDGNGDFDTYVEISTGASLEATGKIAYGIRAEEGSVTLDGGFASATGTDSAYGASFYSDESERKLLTLRGQAGITATGANDATGADMIGSTLNLEGAATIRAEASNATGVSVYGGGMNVDGDSIQIEASSTGSTGTADAVLVYAQADAAASYEIPLEWLAGGAKATASNADSAYAVKVALPYSPEDDPTVCQAYIRPGAGLFEGRVGVARGGVPVTGSGAMQISGGSYTVRPDDGDLAEGCSMDGEEPPYQVTGMYILTVEDGTSSISGYYAEGEEVSVNANSPEEGKKFEKWTWRGARTLEFIGGTDQNSANVLFVMPGSNVTLIANYQTVDNNAASSTGGCYVATAVYGSYDCPEVWTLRRFRDNVLAKTWYGRLFIHLYYAVSPTAVRLFGDQEWFQNFFRGRLDKMVSDLQADGFASTPYQDVQW